MYKLHLNMFLVQKDINVALTLVVIYSNHLLAHAKLDLNLLFWIMADILLNQL